MVPLLKEISVRVERATRQDRLSFKIENPGAAAQLE